MESPIVIDDDFTLDVVEEEGGNVANEDISYRDTAPESDYTDFLNVRVKEEFDIDFEDNYLFSENFVEIAEIKTEIKVEVEDEEEFEHETEFSSFDAETQILVEDIAPIPLPDLVPEEIPNITLPPATVTENKIIEEIEPEKIPDFVPIHLPSKQSSSQSNSQPTPKNNKETNPPPLEPTLDRRKVGTVVKKVPQPTKPNYQRRQPYNDKSSQPYNDKSIVPTKFRNQRKLRNYGPNRFNNLTPNSFFARRTHQNFWNRNSNRMGYNQSFPNNPPAFNSSVDWQTYSTILSALNQILGNNQNMHFDNNKTDRWPVPFEGRKRQFSRPNWRNQYRDRPQVWANEYGNSAPSIQSSMQWVNKFENVAPSFNNPTQLQMYTSILSAVTQLSNGVVMQNCQNYMAYSNNNVKLEMSVLNVFRSFSGC